MTSVRPAIGWTAVTTGPLVLIAAFATDMLPDPAFDAPDARYLINMSTALVAISLALFMALAARQVREAPIVLLALAFLGVAGMVLTRAITSPGVMVSARHAWLQYIASFTLLPGAFFLALSSFDLSPRLRETIVTRQKLILGFFIAALILAGVVGFVSSAGLMPAVVAGTSTSRALTPGKRDPGATVVLVTGQAVGLTPSTAAGPAITRVTGLDVMPAGSLQWALSAVTFCLLAVAAWRFARSYRLSKTPQVASFLASAILLAQAQLAFATSRLWHLSWWNFHLLVLLGLLVPLIGLGMEYRRGNGIHGVVEGLFLRETVAQLQSQYTDVIVALVGAVEARDLYTRGHSHRVATLSYEIARELRLPRERVRIIHQAAILHDIGKIGVPDAILNKTGALTGEEFAVIQEHPVRGHEIIRDVRSLREEIPGVRWHHERLDGSGYPDGLVGSAIPIDARIIAVADVFDALTSNRSYRTAFAVERALTILREEAGTRLDRDCVEALSRVLACRAESGESEPMVEGAAV